MFLSFVRIYNVIKLDGVSHDLRGWDTDKLKAVKFYPNNHLN